MATDGPVVLLVDDSSFMRKRIRKAMEQAALDVSCVEAEDGEVAVDRLDEVDRLDLVVLDWVMPNMTGIEVLRAVRSHARHGLVPVLMVTSESSKRKVMEAISAGVSDYLAKPFTPEALEQKVRRHLERQVFARAPATEAIRG